MKRGRGFSLIELLVVMAVLGILAAAAQPLVELQVQHEKERELRAALWTIRDAIDDYKRAWDRGLIARAGPPSGYPASLHTLVVGVPAAAAPHAPVFFLRRIPRDPFASQEQREEQMWALRSYASPPNAPRSGEDVYDVYSRSDRVGLNGLALKDW